MNAELQDRQVRPWRSAFLVSMTTFALAFTTLGIAPAGANQQGASASPTSDESEITRLLISYETGVTPVDASGEVTGQNYVQSVELEDLDRIGKNLFTVDLPSSVSESEAIKIATELEKSPQVKIAEPDFPISLAVTESVTTQDVSASGLWGLDRIDQRPSALNGTYKFDYTGLGVDAYVFDSGIFPHDEFQGRLQLGYDAISDLEDTEMERHSIDCSDNGHGTHVAGILGGTTFGVAKDVSLIPIRVFDCIGDANTSDLINAIYWVMLHHQPGRLAVANMSLGGYKSDILNEWVQALIADGVHVVVASGNSNADACNYSPASAPGTITVNSSGITDSRSGFSNFGSCTDIFAPGEFILSASNGDATSTATISGTSMATPFVAGAVAKTLEANPNFDRSQIVDKLLKNSTPFVSAKPGDPSRLLFSPDLLTEQRELAELQASMAAKLVAEQAAAKKRLADQKAAAARLAASPPVVKKSLKVKALKKKRISISVAAPKGSKTVLQRKVGKKWRTVNSKTTVSKTTIKVSKSGKYRVRIKLPTGTVTSKTFRVK